MPACGPVAQRTNQIAHQTHGQAAEENAEEGYDDPLHSHPSQSWAQGSDQEDKVQHG